MKAQIQSLRDGDPKKFQGWTLKGLLGEGGQSTIYLAEKNGQIAALKIIRKEYLHDEKAVDRFFTEIKNLELLDHPNIARVLEVEDSGKFIAIEYIQGFNLEDYVAESGPLQIEEWWNFALNLTKTIEYCHSKGIIHKDISPKNIIAGPKGPVLIDFGISYLENDPRLTSKEETIGTPPFMSPEHFGIARPKEMDNFSLAGTLIFAATGHYPFSGETKAEWRESIRFDHPDFSGLSEDQIKLLSPLLYKKPEHRGSLVTFSKLLSELIASETQSDFVIKEFAKVNQESEKKLVQEKKKLKLKNQSIKNVIATAAVISLISVGAVSFGIVAIQNNSRDNAKNSTVYVDGAEVTTTESNAVLGADTQKDNSPINKEIQANLDLAKKFYTANQLDKALVYAKLAANAGNAHGIYDVGLILADQNKSQEAIKWYEKAANLGYGDAFWNLGGLYEKLGQVDSALSWYEKGAKNNNVGSLNALGYYYGETLKNNLKAIPYYKKSAELGDVLGMANLGFVYDQLNDKENAKIWYKKASDLGNVDASLNLGYLFEEAADWTNARKYYQRAADKKDPTAMYDLAIVLGNHFGQGDKGCLLLKEALNIKSIEPAIKKEVEAAISKGCTTTQVTELGGTPKPIASSAGNFAESPEEIPNVAIKRIFGRSFESSTGFDWLVPLTNSNSDPVPPITNLQFRLIGYSNKIWLDIGYKLKKSSYGIQAQVDKLALETILKKSVCPEFRFVRIENGKVANIWLPETPECATDYVP